MARRLPNSSQVSKRDQCHGDAVRTTHARELRSTLAEKSSARIHQLLEPVPRSLHRKLQINIQATSLTRGAAGMQTRNEGGHASIHPAVDDGSAPEILHKCFSSKFLGTRGLAEAAPPRGV